MLDQKHLRKCDKLLPICGLLVYNELQQMDNRDLCNESTHE